jgi:hypothetical protein
MTPKKEPFSLKINFEINSANIKKFFHKAKGTTIILLGTGTVVHGTFDPQFYIDILRKFGIILTTFFK